MAKGVTAYDDADVAVAADDDADADADDADDDCADDDDDDGDDDDVVDENDDNHVRPQRTNVSWYPLRPTRTS